ncbi:MAG: redoxin family protein [Victivallales bacterium]|nr:redoxin family protein [Victivallales bacterium]
MKMQHGLKNVFVMLALAAVCALPLFGQEATAENWLEKRFGKELVNAKGEKVATSTLAGKTVGIYFSAHWCPPCRAFTPKLVEFRDAVAKDNFEIVFISFDKDEDAMKGYMKDTKMGWLAVPFTAAQRKAVANEYGVNGIPTLVILDKNGKTITRSGRGDVTSKGKDALKEWTKAKAEK